MKEHLRKATITYHGDEHRWVIWEVLQLKMAEKDYHAAVFCLRTIERDIDDAGLVIGSYERKWLNAAWTALVGIMQNNETSYH